MSKWLRAGLISCVLPGVADVQAGMAEDWIRSFAESEIIFERTDSNVPFLPLAFLDASYYGDTELRSHNQVQLTYNQTSISQGAVAPFLISPRDALLIGEWVNLSSFETNQNIINPALEDFELYSIALPVGWLHQQNEAWQWGGFIMPLGHYATIPGGGWSWETMGGVLSRYVQRDGLWWAFGFYFDVGSAEDVYLPYLGVSWEINEYWTLSAVMPWPQILYAPSKNTLIHFGASPSGSSWMLDQQEAQISYVLDSWDLGFGIEKRLSGNIWIMAAAGLGGLRGFYVTGDSQEWPEFDVDASPFVRMGINFRPSLQE